MSEVYCFTAPSNLQISYKLATSTSPSKKPLILLIHFWGGSAATWDLLTAQLAESYNIVAPSLHGWGKSEASLNAKEYGMSSYAEDIYALLTDMERNANLRVLLSQGVVIVGHSMGGKIAQNLVAHMGRLADIGVSITGLILVAPAPSGQFALPQEMRKQQIHAYQDVGSAEYVIRNVLLARPDCVTNDVVHALVKDAVTGSKFAKAAWPEYGMGEDYETQLMDALSSNDWWAAKRIMVIVGLHDRVETPENVENRVVAILKSAGVPVRQEMIECGHLIPVEAPNKLAAVMSDFISSI